VFNNAADEDGDGLRDYYFTKRMADFGGRGNNAKRDTFRVVGGLEGAFASDKWHYEGFYAFGQTKEAQTSGGQVNVLNFRNALEAIPDADDVDGDGNTTEAICRRRERAASKVAFRSMCSASTRCRRPLSITSRLRVHWPRSPRSACLGASLTGEVFDLPAGPLAIALGAEYREEFSSSEFDPLTQAGLNAGNAIPPTRRRVRCSRGLPRNERADPQGTAVC
jgi:hypothetical protein